jgi:hypothetical protein|tara:strand:+ start:275 stop:436 length:162 start_codon:yes stop_codon:yes gene_type:complete
MKNYTLDCKYYDKEFSSIDELIEDVTISGMDPNYEILKNGIKTGEDAIDLITK